MLACLPMAAFAQNPVAEAQVHQRDAREAYRDGDFAAFTRSLETAHELNPASLATRYNLARGYAISGEHDKAVMLLKGLIDARLVYELGDEQDFASLRELPAFQALLDQVEKNRTPLENSEPYYAFAQLGLIPEGVAYDQSTRRLFFGSMRTGEVYVLDADRTLSKFASVDAAGRLSAIGMTVDPERGLLWVVGTSFSLAENYPAGEPTISGVFGFDLASGELQREHLIDNADLGLNDVALGPDGTLYASGGVLHRLDETAGRLVPLATTPALYGSNGIVADPDGKTLYVSSYPVSLAAIDLETNTLQFLEAPANTSLYGIDGLYWHEGDLVGIQNGVRPWRLLRLSLDASGRTVTAARIIEYGNEATTPTTGAIFNNRIHYIGQGPAPDPVPGQFPAGIGEYLGETLIRSAPLEP